MLSTSSQPKFTLLSTLTPPSPSRAWLTAPHPTLPLLATCSADKIVRIHSLTTFTLLSTISGGHKRSVRTCAWKPNLKGESVLATGSFDASVGIWRHYDTDEARPEATETEITATQNTEEEDDPEDWRFAIVLDGHESEVKSVAWSTGGNLLATCSRDKSVWIWEEVGEDDYETVAVLQEHEGDVKCVAWHPEEELVASASYDDDVRLWREDVDDWGCVGVLRGHGSTVWCVAWEGVHPHVVGDMTGQESIMKKWTERREAAGPRLLSCSDDRTIKVWRRNPMKRVQQSRLSIIKSGNSEEEWVQESQLPQVHSRPVYAVAWSKNGRIVSTGGDGTVAVYEEQWQDTETQPALQTRTEAVDGEDALGNPESTTPEPMTGVQVAGEQSSTTDSEEGKQPTRWTVMAQLEAAHGVFEVNHVAWARKPASKAVAPAPEEEFIVTTGDDGSVKVWELNL